jgi:hypothetical protein
MPVVLRGIPAGDQPQTPRTGEEHPAGDVGPDGPHPPKALAVLMRPHSALGTGGGFVSPSRGAIGLGDD